jgi:hypothetical protein
MDDRSPPHLSPDFLDRVRRTYRLGLARVGASATGSIWNSIKGLQAPVHEALVAENDDDLRRIFSDPATSDLYYGVDNVCRSLLPGRANSGICYDVAHSQLLYLSRAARVAAPNDSDFDCEVLLSRLDTLLNQRVSFPAPFRGEFGYPTSRGIASDRAIQAIYQTWRLLALTESSASKSIVEIGPGMGRTAYYAYQAGLADYTTIDLPLGVVAQACFLGAVIGPNKIWMPSDDEKLAGGRIKLLFAGTQPVRHFDVAINVDSLTEMPWSAAADYAAWISHHAKSFLSINHERNNFTVTDLAATALNVTHQDSRPCPVRPDYMEQLFFLDSNKVIGTRGTWARVVRLRANALSRFARRATAAVRRRIARFSGRWLG